MMEAALPSLWASLYSWCSPTVLFLLLNLVIGTIAVSSKSAARHREPEEGGDQPKLARAPSAIFGRLSSFKFGRQPEDGGDQPKLARAPSAIFGRLRSFRFAREPSVDASLLAPNATTETVESQPQPEEVHFSRSQSDAQPTAGEVLPKLAAKLKKSASTKSAFAHFAESDIVPPAPAPAAAAVVEDEEEEEVKEVDVQADAFINRFRKQLQLQRLDSLMRYKEMLNRGR